MEAKSLECATEGLFATKVANLYTIYHFSGDEVEISTAMYLSPNGLGESLRGMHKQLILERYDTDQIRTILPENFPRQNRKGTSLKQLTEEESLELSSAMNS